jgi:hypothetical protein
MAGSDGSRSSSSDERAGIGIAESTSEPAPATSGIQVPPPPATGFAPGPGAAGIAIGIAPDASGGRPPVGIAVAPEGEGPAPSAAADFTSPLIQEPSAITLDLVTLINNEKNTIEQQGACDKVLGMREDDILDGRITDPAVVRWQIDRFRDKYQEQEKLNSALKTYNSFPGWVKWRRAILEIGKSPDPIKAFREFAAPRRKNRAFALLLIDARAQLRDGILEWREQQALWDYAKELGLTRQDCEEAYRQADEERVKAGLPRAVRHSKPPPPTTGWRAYRVLGGGDDDVWGLEQLLDAIIENFPTAVKAAMESEDKTSSLVGYLSGCVGPEAKEAHKIAVRARRDAIADQVDPTAAVWQFLWSSGRPTLHLDPGKLPARKKNCRIDDLDGLRAAVETSASAVDTLAVLLTAGLLERWMATVPKHAEAAAVSRRWREQLRAVPTSKLEGEQRRAVIETLWAAGIKILPLRHDRGDAVSPAYNTRDVVQALEQYPTWKFFGWALEAGVVTAWVKLVHPASVRPTEDARKMGHLGTATWLWKHGSRKLSLGAGQPTVESLAQLLQLTDNGEAVLLDEVVERGELAVWAREILRRDDLAQAADEIRGDNKGSKAERWRQQAGARTYKIKGQSADTPRAFAMLALIAHQQGDVASGGALLGWSDIDAALRSEIPERRFKAVDPGLSVNLHAIAEVSGTPRDRALAACLAAGLTRLPVSNGAGLHVVLDGLQDLAARIHAPGLRAELARLLQSGVLMWWIPNCMPDPPAELIEFVVGKFHACASATEAQKHAMIDAIVRFGLRTGACYLAPGLVAGDYAALQAVALDVSNFAVLASEEVRERVREACGEGGDPMIPGLSSQPSTLSEQDLAIVPSTARAMMFAWEWLKTPVLWLGQAPYRVVCHDEVLALLADPQGRRAVQEAAVSGLLGLWLMSQMSLEIPDTLRSNSGMGGAGVREDAFPAFALWLGDARPRVRVTLSQSSLSVEEGGGALLRYEVANDDPLRAAPIVLTATGSNLGLWLQPPGDERWSDGPLRMTLDKASVASGKLWVMSVEGHAGTISGALTATFDVPGSSEEASVAPFSVRVRFPIIRVLKWAAAAMGIGLAAALVIRSFLHGIFFHNGLISVLAKGGELRDPATEGLIGAGLLVAVAFIQRVILARKYQLGPTKPNLRAAWKATVWSAIALAPIGSCHGCVVGCGKGSGLESCGNGVSSCMEEGAGGVGLGVAIGLLLLLRPGAVYSEVVKGLPQDFLFLALCVLAIFSGPLGAAVTYMYNSLDIAAVSTAMSLGFGSTLTSSAFVGFAAWGAVLGLAIGLRRGFHAIKRPVVGWVLCLVFPALLIGIVAMRTTPQRMMSLSPNPSANASECSAAIAHVAEVMKDLAPGADPDPAARFIAYKETQAYQQEIDRAVSICVKRKVKKTDIECLFRAAVPADVKQCNPFWLEDNP